MAKTMVAAGTLTGHRELDNTAIALGDHLSGTFARAVRVQCRSLSWLLSPTARLELAALLELIADALTVAERDAVVAPGKLAEVGKDPERSDSGRDRTV
jgi:threonine dehydrogenase-like Zn-dependent dehydrogenase